VNDDHDLSIANYLKPRQVWISATLLTADVIFKALIRNCLCIALFQLSRFRYHEGRIGGITNIKFPLSLLLPTSNMSASVKDKWLRKQII